MQAVSLSLFRFEGPRTQHWALWRMLFARPRLKALPGIGFLKMCGTGSREGFFPWPNWAVYAVLATWPSLAHARAQVAGGAPYRRYRERAAEALTLYLHPVRSRGRWAGVEPFEIAASPPGPLAVLTRAAIRPRRLLAFWGRTPAIRASIPRDGLRLQIGMGELPWLNQITFTVWDDPEALRRFAYAAGPHGEAVAAARRDGYFAEELFARFTVAACEGTWKGASPLPELARAAAA